MATDIEVRAAIDSERQELADLLQELPSESWDSETLCSGWRVRELVAYLTMPFRYSGTVALGIDRKVPENRLRLVLAGVPPKVKYSGRRFAAGQLRGEQSARFTRA